MWRLFMYRWHALIFTAFAHIDTIKNIENARATRKCNIAWDDNGERANEL